MKPTGILLSQWVNNGRTQLSMTGTSQRRCKALGASREHLPEQRANPEGNGKMSCLYHLRGFDMTRRSGLATSRS